MLRTFLKKNKKGFTLTELMIVVVIIGILTAIAIPIYSSVTDKAAKSAHKDNIRTIQSVITQLTANEEVSAENVSIDATGKLTEACGSLASGDSIIGEGATAYLKAWPTVPKKLQDTFGDTYEVKNGVVVCKGNIDVDNYPVDESTATYSGGGDVDPVDP